MIFTKLLFIFNFSKVSFPVAIWINFAIQQFFMGYVLLENINLMYVAELCRYIWCR